MPMKKDQPTDIDSYIAQFPKETQKLLQQMRKTIQKAAPKAVETINYGIPTFVLQGNLVHFAAYKNHIGFYPAPSGLKAFSKELESYEGAKGSVKFPIDQPLPLATLTKIVQFRVQENQENAATRLQKKTLATCLRGHQYHKTIDCPTCPFCQKDNVSKDGFLSVLSAPARRALENAGVKTLKQLAKYSEEAILELHGVGPSSLPKMKAALKAEGLAFKKNPL